MPLPRPGAGLETLGAGWRDTGKAWAAQDQVWFGLAVGKSQCQSLQLRPDLPPLTVRTSFVGPGYQKA